MFFGDYNSHAVPYFVSSSFLPLDLLYFKSVAILMHDISNSLTATNTIYLTYLLPNLIFIHIIQVYFYLFVYIFNIFFYSFSLVFLMIYLYIYYIRVTTARLC